MLTQNQTCEQCGKQALFVCSQCKWASYCSRQHQLQHWRVHRQHCNILKSYQFRKEQTEINKSRTEVRKKYFENFSHKIFDNCITLAEQMLNIQKKLIKDSRQIFNQMEYGISVCLLARSYLNVRHQAKASITINSYLDQKLHFLKDMRDVISFQKILSKEQTKKDKHRHTQNPQQFDSPTHISNTLQKNTIQDNLTNPLAILRQFSIKKVSLIASVANIVHCVKQPVVPIYEIYTEHIEKMFGRESFEASNCYFMIGSHYMENKQYYKSIACFMRAAQIRGNMAGDCYYNLGILFHLLKKSNVALMMFQNAAKLRQNQFSQNSSQVADVYHNIALIHRSMGNYKGAIQNLQKIALIYSKDKNSLEYKNAKQSIKQLEAAFRLYMQRTNQGALTTGLMKDLKKTIRKVSKGQQDALSENSMRQDKDEKQRLSGENNYLKLTDQFVNKLNPLQSFHLSQLQIQLGKCQTIFMAANTLGSSHFLKIIKLSKLEQLIKDNENLFKNVSIQKLSKRGFKDINMIIS